MLRGNAVLAAALALLVIPPAAEAAYPGANGKIGFGRDVGGNVELFTMDPGGSSQASFSGAAGGSGASYSADGRTVAYYRDGDVVVRNADGNGTPTVFEPASGASETFGFPALSPDGTVVAYESIFSIGITVVSIKIRKVDGTGSVQSLSGFAPAFNSNADLLYTVDVDPGVAADLDIYLKPNNYEAAQPLVTGSTLDSAADMSGTGGHLVFERYVGDDWDLYTRAPGGSISPLVATNSDEQQAVFSPDGTKIAFGRGGEIWIVNSDGTGVQENITDTGAADADSNPGWSVVPAPIAVPTPPVGAPPPALRAKKCKKGTRLKKGKCKRKKRKG